MAVGFGGEPVTFDRKDYSLSCACAQRQQRCCLARQHCQSIAMCPADLPGASVDHADRTERDAGRSHDRRAGVEAQVRIARHERIRREARVERGVFNHQQRVGHFDGVGAKRMRPRHVGNRQADRGLVPLSMPVDERHQGNGRVADMGGKRGNIVVGGLGLGVEHAQIIQRLETRFIVGLTLRRQHTSTL